MKIKQSIHRGCRLHVALGVLLCLASLQVWGKKGTVEAGQTYNSESDYNTIANVFANSALLPDTLKNLDTLVLKGMVSRPASVTAPLELARTLTVIGYAGTASGIIAQPASGLTYRHLQVAANDVLLQNLIFAGPNVASVSANGDVAMRASLNANHGGGISFTYNDTLAIRGCKVVGCQAWNTSPNPTRGGAVYVSGSGSCLLIEDTEISHSYNNSASVNGGAITAAMTTTLIMRGANRLLHNKTTGSGAGFDARGNVQIADSGGVYVGNKASTTTAYGGGVFCIALLGSVAQSVSFRKSRFERDTAVG
ncbi:MAG: hypothetical protein LBS94_02665, partial [Prevotellaceae bacterium]|nr:hypothetical protein [Prevotellaceae bacterium]